MKPKSIDRYIIDQEIFDVASFDYYTGIQWCKDHGIPSVNQIEDKGFPWQLMYKNKCYIVSCAEVIVRIPTTYFPDIERKTEVFA